MNADMDAADLSCLKKIVSGGQTGVDQAALDAAIFLAIPHGGWCPKGRRSECGPIPDCYQLSESHASDYSVRTEQNIVDSDATLIFHIGKMSGGTAFTLKMARKHKRPYMTIDLAENPNAQSVREWICNEQIAILNVAGPRASSTEGIGDLARTLLVRILESL